MAAKKGSDRAKLFCSQGGSKSSGAPGRQGDPGRDLQGQDLGCGGDDTESVRRTMPREQ